MQEYLLLIEQKNVSFMNINGTWGILRGCLDLI